MAQVVSPTSQSRVQLVAIIDHQEDCFFPVKDGSTRPTPYRAGRLPDSSIVDGLPVAITVSIPGSDSNCREDSVDEFLSRQDAEEATLLPDPAAKEG
jgi:hypothetical protein